MLIRSRMGFIFIFIASLSIKQTMAMDSADTQKAKIISIILDKKKPLSVTSTFNIRPNDAITIKTPGKACVVAKHFNNFFLECDKHLDARYIEFAALECLSLQDIVPHHDYETLKDFIDRVQDKNKMIVFTKIGDQNDFGFVSCPLKKKLRLKSYFDLTKHETYRYHLAKIVQVALGGDSPGRSHEIDFISFVRIFKDFLEESSANKKAKNA